MIEPLLRQLADVQRVAEKTNHQTKGKKNKNVQGGEKDARLEVANLAANALPAFP